MKVRLLRDCYDGKQGEVLDLDERTAFAWVQGEIAEFVDPVTTTEKVKAERVKAAPVNRVKSKPVNRKKTPETEE